MATPEEEIAKLKEDLRVAREYIAKFGEKTDAVTKSIESMIRTTNAGTRSQEALNRGKTVEKKLVEEASKNYKELYKAVDDGTKTQKQINEEMAAQRLQIRRNTDLNNQQKASLLASLDAARAKAQGELQHQKITEGFSNSLEKASKFLAPFGTAISSVVGTLTSSASPISGAASIIGAEAKLIGTGLGAAGQGLTDVGQAGMMAGGRMKVLGAAATVAGLALQGAGKLGSAAAELAEFMGKEGQKFVDAYTTATAAGAAFADGMTGLRNAAGTAGLTVEDMAAVVASNTEALAKSGMGVAEGTRALARASAQLRDPEKGLGIQLFRMGITDVKEQASLAAQTMGMLRTQGNSSLDVEKKVAETTVQYAKDLKTLQSLTGEDIKAKQKAAELATMESDIMGMLSPEEAAKFQAALRTLPDDYKKGVMEMVSSGGVAVDQAFNVARTNSKAVGDLVNTVYSGIFDSNKSAADYQRTVEQARGKAAEGIREEMKGTGRTLSMAARMTGDPLLQGTKALYDSLTRTTFTAEDAKKTRDSVDGMANTTNEVTNEMGGVAEEFNKAKVALQQLTLSDEGMKKMFEIMKGGVSILTEFFNKIREFLGLPPAGGASQSMSDAQRAQANATAGLGYGAAGSAAFAPGGAIVAPSLAMGAAQLQILSNTTQGQDYMRILQEDKSGMLGAGNPDMAFGAGILGAPQQAPPDAFGNWLKSMLPKFATGGIASGPTSGYPVMLHGREMVIPMPDDVGANNVRSSPLPGMSGAAETSENMLNVMTKMSENFEVMLRKMEDVANHTERTARGVA